jgi:protein-tyrosine phosphatase
MHLSSLVLLRIMVDIHCHIVPGVDDGAVSLEMSLAMIEMAKQCGVTSILTTPHIRGSADDAIVHAMHKKAFQKILDAKPDMDLHLGGEVRVTPETHGITNRPEYTTDERSKYILLEMEFDKVPPYFTRLLFDFRLQGITPIVAHPERNAGVLKNPEHALEFVRQGAVLQVTNGSLLGELGETIQECALLLFDCGLAGILASDAHNLTTRPFSNWPETYEYARELEKKGNSILPFSADSLCTHNPDAVCHGGLIPPIELDESAIHKIQKRLSKNGSSPVKRKRFFFM